MTKAKTNVRQNIEAPLELRQLNQWVTWRAEKREGKLTKIPYPTTGNGMASTTNPRTWSSYEAVIKAYMSGGYSGIGFVFTKKSGKTGIDLDHCRDPQTGKIADWAMNIINKLNSYAEISPSGTGVKIIIEAELPPGGNRKGDIEMYDTGRYFTITGNHLAGTPETIEKRQAELDELHASIFKKDKPATKHDGGNENHPVDLDDTELISKAMAATNGAVFEKLWNGDTAAYEGDDSAADLALCSHLAFWTDNNPEQIDRLFRQSRLYREKWERATYREPTILKACDSGNSYTQGYPGRGGEDIRGCHARHETVTNRDIAERDNRYRPLQTVTCRDITAEDIRQWIIESDGSYFSTKELDTDLGINSQKQKDNRRQVLNRLKVAGEVEKHPKANSLFRYINADASTIAIFDSEAVKPLPVTLPLGIGEFVDLYPGNEIVVAGSPNAGKTALLLNIAKDNINGPMPIVYFSSEMGAAELTLRLRKFEGVTEYDWLKVAWMERQLNFQDVVKESYLNIIDYLEACTDLYLMADHLASIQRKATKGLTVVAIQKAHGRDLGRGAEFSSEKPRLYLSVDPGKIKIIKAKNWSKEAVNPNGLVCNFKLVNGAKFIQESDWHHEEF